MQPQKSILMHQLPPAPQCRALRVQSAHCACTWWDLHTRLGLFPHCELGGARAAGHPERTQPCDPALAFHQLAPHKPTSRVGKVLESRTGGPKGATFAKGG